MGIFQHKVPKPLQRTARAWETGLTASNILQVGNIALSEHIPAPPCRDLSTGHLATPAGLWGKNSTIIGSASVPVGEIT